MIVSILSVILIIAGVVYYFITNWTQQRIVTDPSGYESCFGKEAAHKNKGTSPKTGESYLAFNAIFPEELPDTAEAEEFYYEYYNPWDPCYLGYLVYTCDETDYSLEIERLEKLPKQANPLVYGAVSFPYPTAAVYASDYGYIYALADVENLRLIYVELTFCNYYTDIEYERVIPAKYLPTGFDAKEGNPARVEWELKSRPIPESFIDMDYLVLVQDELGPFSELQPPWYKYALLGSSYDSYEKGVSCYNEVNLLYEKWQIDNKFERLKEENGEERTNYHYRRHIIAFSPDGERILLDTELEPPYSDESL